MIRAEMKFNREALRKRQQRIREQGRQIVIMHALGAAAALYQVYPVGPEHTGKNAGTPHTRDTFKILVDGVVIAEQGNFWTVDALGTKAIEERFQVVFQAAGAAFFVEFGTIFSDARPVIRQEIKITQQNILNDLRKLNTSL